MMFPLLYIMPPEPSAAVFYNIKTKQRNLIQPVRVISCTLFRVLWFLLLDWFSVVFVLLVCLNATSHNDVFGRKSGQNS